LPKCKEQKIRLQLLYELLHRHTDEDNPLSTEQIIDMLRNNHGVTVQNRALIKDVKLLNEYGYEINRFKKKGYFFYVADRAFDIPELKVLIDAVQAASFIPENQTERFIDKIAALAGTHRAELLKQNIVYFDTVKHSNKYIFYSIDTLISAIGQKKKASFLYYALDIDKNKVYRKCGERYVVNPLSLIYTNDKYYLVCYSDKYRTLTNYRIDRMEKVEIEPHGITPVKKFENCNIHAYKQQAFSMFGGELKDVALTVDNACLDAILDKFGEQTPLFKIDADSFSVKAKVQVSPTFFGWCLTSCQKIRITAPVEVVKGFEIYKASVMNTVPPP